MKRSIAILCLLLVALCGCSQNKEEYLENKLNNNISVNKTEENNEIMIQASGEEIIENETESGNKEDI